MIYVFSGFENNASVVYDGSTLSKEQRDRGIALESLPVKEEIEGKVAILKADKNGNVWWDYVKVESTENDKLEQLEQALLEATSLRANQEEKNVQNEQAILERTTSIGGRR